MDTEFIEQFSGDISCFRLRTARQKKRLRYKDFDKQLRDIDRQQNETWKAIRNLGWEPLSPPYQQGWKRFFVLRDDVARSKNAAFYNGILEKINTQEWSHRKDFKVKRRKFGKKIYVVRPQQLHAPDNWHWHRLRFSEKERQQFHEVWKMRKSGELVKRFVFNEPWRFILQVRPFMVDKVRIKDAALESKAKQIGDYLQRNGYRYRLARITGGYKHWKWRDNQKANYRNPLENKPLNDILLDAKEECISGFF